MKDIVTILLMIVPMFRTIWMNAYLIVDEDDFHVLEIDGEYVPELDVDELQPDYLIRFRIFTFLGFAFFPKPITNPISFEDYQKYHTGAMNNDA